MLKLFIAPFIALVQSNVSLLEAEQLFSSGNIEKAKQAYELLIENKQTSASNLAQAQCRMGILLSMTQEMQKSTEFIEKSIFSNVMSKEKKDVCSYALLQVYTVTNKFEKSYQIFKTLGQNTLGSPYKQRVFLLGAISAQALNNNNEEIEALEALKHSMEKELIPKVDISILNKSLSKAEIDSRLIELKNKNKLKELEPAVLNTQNQIQGELNHSWAGSKWIKELENFLQDSNRQNEPIKVGILLPSHHSLTKYNSKILRGVSSFLSSDFQTINKLQMSVGSAKSDPGSLELEAVRLVLEKKVQVIVGPFTGTHAAALASVSKVFNIPIISLGAVANTPELNMGSFVRMGILANSQAETLSQTIKEKYSKINSIAIFAPTDSYGLEMSQAFEQAAIKKGIKIIRKDWFNTNQSSFQEAIQEIVNQSKSKSIPYEVRQNLKDAKLKAKEEKRKFDPSKFKIPTLLDFQSVFIPESLPKVRLIATTFAFYDVKKMLYVGDKQWFEGSGNQTYADDFLLGSPVAALVQGNYFPFLYSDLESSSQSSSLDLERQAFDSLVYIYVAGQKLSQAKKSFMDIWVNKDFVAEGTAKYGPVDDSGSPSAQFQTQSFKQGKFSVELLNPAWYE